MKHITPQNQTYCFNYLIAQNQISQDKMLLLFQSILASCSKSNARVATGMMPNYSTKYELTIFVSHFIFETTNFGVITS